MQEHNRSSQDASPDVGGIYKTTVSGRSSQDRSQSSGGRSVYKATVSGPTTMIINLGEPRQPPIITNNVHQHQPQQMGNMSNMRTIITNSVLSNNNNIMNNNNNNTNSNDLLSLLAPISTVMSTNGVILATANNATIDAHPYQVQQVNQQTQQQQQHHLSHHQMITNSMVIQHQQQQHNHQQHQILHHLNESGAIIAATSMNNNNVHTNHSNHNISSSNSLLSNPSIGAVHHLGADIELFEIPCTSDSNSNSNSIHNTAHLQSDDVGNGGSGLQCTVINTQNTTVTMTSTTVGAGDLPRAPAIGDTVDLSPATNAQIVYVNSAGEVALAMSDVNKLADTQVQPNGHQHSDNNSQHSALEDSLSAGLSMTSEQAESLMKEAVELHKQEDAAQLNLLSIGGGDAGGDSSSGHLAGDSAEQTRFSSPGSMDMDLDATLDEEDMEEGVYVDGSNSNQSQTQTVIAGGQQLSLLPGSSSGVPNSSIVGGGGYLSHLPSMSVVNGGESTANTTMVVGGNASSTPNSAGGGADQTENKYCIEELCPVCGDKVSGYHYGLLTCESCKGFFKRTVQNKKVYTCVADRQCLIDKTQRKRCPFCRFQKCLDVGMKLEAVRADRMRGGRNKFGPMYKRDRARKLQIMRQRQLAIQTIRGPDGSSPLDSGNYSQSYLNIKQEIQIPQISSLTSSSPDSSPSPIAIALGQVPTPMSVGTSSSGSSNSIGNGGGGGSQASGHSSSSCVGGNGSGNAIGSGVGGGGGGGGGGSSGGGIGAVSGGPGGTGSANHLVGSQLGVNGGSANSIPSTTTSSTVHNTATDSKQWFHANSTTASPHSLSPKQFGFDSGSNPTSTADSGPVSEPQSKKPNWKNSKSLNFPRVSPMIRDFVQSVDDREWSQQLFSLLQSQSYNQCEVDVFELMCKVLDQNLFSQVDWARNTIFFKDLKVDDQMKLLQNSWSDMLILDHLHQRIHNNLPDETTLHNGQKFDLLGLGLLGVPQLSESFNQLQIKLVDLKFDVGDYICLKFLLLLNPVSADMRGITNLKHVQEGFDNVQAALLDYTLTCYATVTEKFTKLIGIIPQIHSMAAQGEEHLYVKHCAGGAPTQTLLMEMLHAKRK